MNLADYRKLRKLMALTVSSNDAEALAALRAASALMLRGGVTWDTFFDRTVRIEEPVEQADEDEDEEEAGGVPLDEVFAKLLDVAGAGLRPFVLDLLALHEGGQRLTPNQTGALMQAYRRNVR